MTSEQPNEASIFNAARKIESADERDAFLTDACGNDTGLRGRVDKLLAAFIEESQFLEQPAPGLEQTVVPDSSRKNFAASLDAGLAVTFSDESAVVVGNTNHSVLKSMSASLTEVPRVFLRAPIEEGDEPIQRPGSPEIPNQPSDSRYQLHGEIARGGMGAVLRGRDTDLGRDLAVKVLLDAHKEKPEVVQRFIEEAQIGGQLQHPGIAPVYELGQFADQRPFFSMKLVKGDTLAKLLLDREDPTTDRSKLVGIFEQVCQTMAYAHSRGVIHRDLKPANIMVGAFGEVQVMDWGLAKVLSSGGVADEKATRKKQAGETLIQTMRSVGSDVPGSVGSAGSETQAGSVMGTPAYMPPEQALGEIDMLDQRADVFGLGAILAEILTGKPPYIADDGTQIYRMASRGKLGDCFDRLDECGADEELISLAKQCLELEPADRPKDANALADQVTGYLESVETKLRTAEVERAGEAARVIEQRKRFRITLWLGAAAIAHLVAGIAATVRQSWIADEQAMVAQAAREEATLEKDNALDAKQEAITAKQQEEAIAEQRRRELYAANMQLADQLYNGQNGEQKRIEELLASWIPIDDQEDLREFSWRYQWNRLHNNARVTVPKCKGVAITPVGRMVVTDSKGLHEVDENGKKRELISWTLNVDWSYFSPDGRWVAINVESGMELYHIQSREKVLSLPQTRCSFSSNGEYLTAFKSGVTIDSLEPGEDAMPVWKLEQDGTVTSSDPLVVGLPLVHGETPRLPVRGESLKIGNMGKSYLRLAKPAHPGTKKHQLVAGYLNGSQEYVYWGHRDNAVCAWSPVSRIVASASSSDGVHLRLISDASEKQVPQNLMIPTHGTKVEILRFSLDGRRLAVGGKDGTIEMWDISALADDAKRSETEVPERSDEGDSDLASISSWPAPRLIRTIKAYKNGISYLDAALNFSPDGSLLTSMDSRGNAKLWEVDNVRGRYDLNPITDKLYGYAGTFPQSTSSGIVWRIGEVPKPDIVLGAGVEEDERVDAIFDPAKGDWHSIAGPETWDRIGLLVRTPRGSQLRVRLENLKGDMHEVTFRIRPVPTGSMGSSVAFAPDGTSVAVSDRALGATRLNLKSGETRRSPVFGWSSEYSPDGRLLAITDSFAVSIRDSETDEEVYRLDTATQRNFLSEISYCGTLAFSPDGNFLAHFSGDRVMEFGYADMIVWRTSDFTKVGDGPLFKTNCALTSVAFSPDSSRMFVCDRKGVVEIWNTADWTKQDSIQTSQGPRNSIAISSDGTRLATASVGTETIRIWDLETRNEVGKLRSPKVVSLAFAPNDRTLAAGCENHEVILWDVESGKRLQTFTGHSDVPGSIAFSRDGQRLASLSLDGVLHIWDAATNDDIEQDPSTLQALLRLGNWRFEQERYAEAETLFSKVIELNQETQHLSTDELADVKRNLKTASDTYARLMERLDEM